MESIQDWLVARGFQVDLTSQAFFQWTNDYQKVSIPFTELMGHTLNTFKEKSVRKGWVSIEGV